MWKVAHCTGFCISLASLQFLLSFLLALTALGCSRQSAPQWMPDPDLSLDLHLHLHLHLDLCPRTVQ